VLTGTSSVSNIDGSSELNEFYREISMRQLLGSAKVSATDLTKHGAT